MPARVPDPAQPRPVRRVRRPARPPTSGVGRRAPSGCCSSRTRATTRGSCSGSWNAAASCRTSCASRTPVASAGRCRAAAGTWSSSTTRCRGCLRTRRGAPRPPALHQPAVPAGVGHRRRAGGRRGDADRRQRLPDEGQPDAPRAGRRARVARVGEPHRSGVAPSVPSPRAKSGRASSSSTPSMPSSRSRRRDRSPSGTCAPKNCSAGRAWR